MKRAATLLIAAIALGAVYLATRPSDRAADVRAFVRELPRNGSPLVRNPGGSGPFESASFGSGPLTTAELVARAHRTLPAANGWRETSRPDGTATFERDSNPPFRLLLKALPIPQLTDAGSVRVEIWGAGATVTSFGRRLFASETEWDRGEEPE